MASLRNERVIVPIAVFFFIAIATALGFVRHEPAARQWCSKTCQSIIGCNLDFSDGVARELGPMCFVRQNQCNSLCDNQPELDKRVWKVVVPPGPWGAIAYDPKKAAWGLSDSAPDPEIARYSAYVFCNRYSYDCKVVDTFRDICMAVATGPNSTVTWVKDKDLNVATQKAIAQCNSQSNSNTCVSRHGTCYPDPTDNRQKED